MWNANRNSYSLYQMALFQWLKWQPSYPKPSHFRYFVLPVVSLQWLELHTSNVVDRLIVARLVLTSEDKPLLKEVWAGHVNHLNFGG